MSRSTDFSSHDAEIYAITLDSLLARRTRDATRRVYVLSDSTPSYRRESLVPEFWGDLLDASAGDSALVRAFEVAAREGRSLRTLAAALRIRLNAPLELAADSTLARLRARADSLRNADPTYPRAAEGYWRVFYGVFPNSYGSSSVSAIGYSADGTRAMLLVSQGCGALCGEGNLVVLHRERGRWRIVRVGMLWVS